MIGGVKFSKYFGTIPMHIRRRNRVLGGPPEAAHVVEQSVHIVHCAQPGQCSSP